MTPLDVPFVIDVMLPAAQAAYLAMSVPTPPLPLPPGYTLVGLIQANPQQAAPAMADAPPDQQHLVVKIVSESSIFGLVAWHAETQTALIAIRGTETLWEWIDDFEAVPVPWWPDPTYGLVHVGFQLVYSHMRASVFGWLDTLTPQRTLISAHSLGGPVAIQLALEIVQRGGVAPEVTTFGGPRAGDEIFAARAHRDLPRLWRVVNFLDLVPQVPIPPIFWHPGEPDGVGTEALVHGGFKFGISLPRVSYAHHLTTYLAGLRKQLPVLGGK